MVLPDTTGCNFTKISHVKTYRRLQDNLLRMMMGVIDWRSLNAEVSK
jgi:hypothetical protein